MTLMAAIEGRLPYLRAEAEARMLDTFEIRVYDNGQVYVYDSILEEDVENSFTPLLTTPGRVKVGGLGVHDAEVGGRTSASVTRSLHIPVGSIAVPANAVAYCTAVHATSDPTLLGARLVLSGPAPGSQTTARRLEVTEVLT